MSTISDLSPVMWLRADSGCKSNGSACSNNGPCDEWEDRTTNGNDVTATKLADADFDSDGDVDGADFLTWQSNNPTASGATRATGDADGDGDVDGADFLVWQDEFGTKTFPTYVTNVLDGKPGLLFTKEAEMSGSTGLLSGEMTIFVLFRPTVNVGNNTRFCDQGGFSGHSQGTNWYIDGTDHRKVNFVYTAPTDNYGALTGDTDATIPAISQTEAEIITAYMDGDKAGVRLNGNEATQSVSVDDCGTQGVFHIRPWNTPMYYFEIVAFDYALTSAEMEDVEDALRDYWDITSV